MTTNHRAAKAAEAYLAACRVHYGCRGQPDHASLWGTRLRSRLAQRFDTTPTSILDALEAA